MLWKLVLTRSTAGPRQRSLQKALERTKTTLLPLGRESTGRVYLYSGIYLAQVPSKSGWKPKVYHWCCVQSPGLTRGQWERLTVATVTSWGRSKTDTKKSVSKAKNIICQASEKALVWLWERENTKGSGEHNRSITTGENRLIGLTHFIAGYPFHCRKDDGNGGKGNEMIGSTHGDDKKRIWHRGGAITGRKTKQITKSGPEPQRYDTIDRKEKIGCMETMMETSEDSPLGSAAVVESGVRKWRQKDIVAVAVFFWRQIK